MILEIGLKHLYIATTCPYRLPATRLREIHRDFIPSTTTPSTRPCRKRVNRPADVAAAVRVTDGYVVDEDRPSRRFLGCENVTYGHLWAIIINSTKRVLHKTRLVTLARRGCLPYTGSHRTFRHKGGHERPGGMRKPSCGTRVRVVGPYRARPRGIERCHEKG